ncbi:ATP/GTP-binding protein [Amycolatopsis sp. EV170708-02-1]|uniref:AAA family ATPase n=1 Tax=Amycolatopsis sp. EV170708-02-1 TaxID=2919322 RepID=UPI001F0B8E67|nr:ATP-binding protein [Amycolatopsis sp. EV170708-02-1]UMP04326.1 ATP-binding protein [Amycolatopsis sp. EV170708-02-1]
MAAIYGANASGKSNLLDGLTYMAVGVLTSKLLGAWPRSVFRLDPQAVERPSTFVIEILAEGTRYTYGFRASDDAVVEEWLYAYPEKRRRVVFERTGDDLRFGSTSASLKSKFAALEELIRGDVLLLSFCSGLELGPLMPVYRWFEQSLRIVSAEGTWASDDVGSRVGHFLQRDARNSHRLLSLLTAADVGIADVLAEQVDEAPSQRDVRLLTGRGAGSVSGPRWRLRFWHGDAESPFELHDESAGTRNWLRLIPTVLDALDEAQVLVVDEIDSSLHPMLTAKLVSLFQSEVTNPNGAQLVFTTHDTSLQGTMLGGSVLERDQIWFVDKNTAGASELYPLTDFKPRKDQNTERRYLAGSYGAVPVLGDFTEAVLGR